MKSAAKAEAVRLRTVEGLSIRAIAKRLFVSPSSVSAWVKAVPVSDVHRQKLLRNIQELGKLGRVRASENALTRRFQWQQEGREAAKKADPFHASGCMLYWGEGGKSRNQVALVNSDADLILFFIKFLSKYFRVRLEDIVLRLNCFTDLKSIEEITGWWAHRLGVPIKCFRKPTICKPSKSSKGTRAGKLEYGTCTVVVNRTEVIQHIYGAIQEYARFDRPSWIQ